jgi:3-methylcrotonyl-CoA carboxylase beta subunit
MNIEFNKNEDVNKQLVFEMKTKLKKIMEGGGAKSAAKQKEKGKMLARERIQYLIDEGSNFLEIGAFAADGMYEEHGGCPSAGVITGIGYVSGRQCMIVANDATVKAGAWFPMTGKKNLRAQEICI